MTAERTTTLRLRRVRFKDGRTLDVIRPKADNRIREEFVGTSERCAKSEVGASMAGFAIVAWSRDGYVFVQYANHDKSPIAGGALPQYVKDCLLAETAVRWSQP